MEKEVVIHTGSGDLKGLLSLPKDPKGIVLFAHGSGSGRYSPRNQFVAKQLQLHQLATLLMDLLTEGEEAIDESTRQFRFDIDLLTERLVEVTKWVSLQPETKELSVGYFGASTGAAAALKAGAKLRSTIRAIVSRGGRPDLAADVLTDVVAPTLLIVGEYDYDVIELNKKALSLLQADKEMVIVPKATHLFEEPGTLVEVARLASSYFLKNL